MKFEEFYYDKDKKIYGISVLNEAYKDSQKKYIDTYYGHMYCPECIIAQLEYHPTAQTPYLKRMKAFSHDEGCSYSCPEVNKEQVRTYYTDEKNLMNINKKLKGCIDLLLKGVKRGGATKSIGGSTNKKIAKDIFTFEEGKSRLLIKRKKITRKLNEPDDYDIPILFYGTVQLEWQEQNRTSQKGEQYKVMYLRVYSQEVVKGQPRRVLRCRIEVSEKKYNYLEDTIKKIATDKMYNIAFMSEMEKVKWNGIEFNNCKLAFSTHIVVEEC